MTKLNEKHDNRKWDMCPSCQTHIRHMLDNAHVHVYQAIAHKVCIRPRWLTTCGVVCKLQEFRFYLAFALLQRRWFTSCWTRRAAPRVKLLWTLLVPKRERPSPVSFSRFEAPPTCAWNSGPKVLNSLMHISATGCSGMTCVFVWVPTSTLASRN